MAGKKGYGAIEETTKLLKYNIYETIETTNYCLKMFGMKNVRLQGRKDEKHHPDKTINPNTVATLRHMEDGLGGFNSNATTYLFGCLSLVV